MENAPAYEKTSDQSTVVGHLTEGQIYSATRSDKVGNDRWFLLEIKKGEKGWVQGFNLLLADAPSAPAASKPLGRQNQSAFAARWIVADVKDVTVYARPSIAGKSMKQISPPTVYEVLESNEGGGDEWYKIKLPNGGEGWVKAMDVNLTKPK